MKALRILLVSRRFWPLVGDSEDAMADLAVGLRRYGAEPTVLSARWSADWPSTTCFQGMPVRRLLVRPGSLWGRFCYQLALTRWLRQSREQFDLVVVARLRREANAALRALRTAAIPVVLRAEPDDVIWQGQSAEGARCRQRCQHAAAVICRDGLTRQSLLDAGYAAVRVHCIPDGIPPLAPPRGGARLDARLALAAANQDLNAAIDAPIAVYIGRLRPDTGLASLVRAWAVVVRHSPMAKLWLIGDGPSRDELHRLVRDLDLSHCVRMPGTFESAEELLRAANLLVHPGLQHGIPRILPIAAASGLQILAAADPEIERELRRDTALAGMVRTLPRGDADAWSKVILDSLRSPSDRLLLARQGRGVLCQRAMSQMIRQHLELFHHLLDQRIIR